VGNVKAKGDGSLNQIQTRIATIQWAIMLRQIKGAVSAGLGLQLKSNSKKG
jgi:hypothetical protein